MVYWYSSVNFLAELPVILLTDLIPHFADSELHRLHAALVNAGSVHSSLQIKQRASFSVEFMLSTSKFRLGGIQVFILSF